MLLLAETMYSIAPLPTNGGHTFCTITVGSYTQEPARSHITCAAPCLQARNKPVEPPKKPEAAPFFLPSAIALPSDPKAIVQSGAEVASVPSHTLRMSGAGLGPDDSELAERTERNGPSTSGRESVGRQISRVHAPAEAQWRSSPLLGALARGEEGGDYAAAAEWLRAASAVAVEREILRIPTEDPFEQARWSWSAARCKPPEYSNVAARALRCYQLCLTSCTRCRTTTRLCVRYLSTF